MCSSDWLVPACYFIFHIRSQQYSDPPWSTTCYIAKDEIILSGVVYSMNDAAAKLISMQANTFYGEKKCKINQIVQS